MPTTTPDVPRRAIAVVAGNEDQSFTPLLMNTCQKLLAVLLESLPDPVVVKHVLYLGLK